MTSGGRAWPRHSCRPDWLLGLRAAPPRPYTAAKVEQPSRDGLTHRALPSSTTTAAANTAAQSGTKGEVDRRTARDSAPPHPPLPCREQLSSVGKRPGAQQAPSAPTTRAHRPPSTQGQQRRRSGSTSATVSSRPAASQPTRPPTHPPCRGRPPSLPPSRPPVGQSTRLAAEESGQLRTQRTVSGKDVRAQRAQRH